MLIISSLVLYQIKIMQKNSIYCENRFIGLKFFIYFLSRTSGVTGYYCNVYRILGKGPIQLQFGIVLALPKENDLKEFDSNGALD